MASKSTPPPKSSSQAARTTERRKEREKQRQRNQMLVIIGVIVVLAVLAVVAIALGNLPSEAPIPEGSVERYAGVTQTRTNEGYPRLGTAAQPVQVSLFSSFDCSSCRTLHDDIMDELVQRVRDGKIALTFVPLYGTGSFTNGQGAARAALCVGEQDAFWPYQDALFAWQGAFGNQAFTQSRLVSGVDKLDLDRAAWEVCSRSGMPDTVLSEARTDAGSLLNFIGTPTITINGAVPTDSDGNVISGGANLLAAIDHAIEISSSRAATPVPEAEATPEATEEATAAPVDAPTEEVTPEATSGS